MDPVDSGHRGDQPHNGGEEEDEQAEDAGEGIGHCQQKDQHHDAEPGVVQAGYASGNQLGSGDGGQI